MDNINFLLELFFPSFCLGCQSEGTFLCSDCEHTLEISEFNYCLCSNQPLRLPGLTGKCNRCVNKKLTGLYSALPYKEKFLTKKLIYQFKYEPYIKSLARSLADILLEHLVLTKNLTEEIWQNSILLPVPMEKSKQKERGYNQAQELAKELGHSLHVPTVFDNLIKIKKTEAQMKLKAKERSENLLGAFKVKNPGQIQDKKVFLVDDVYTTGSTMEECAKVLKDAGAKQVWGIVVAREG